MRILDADCIGCGTMHDDTASPYCGGCLRNWRGSRRRFRRVMLIVTGICSVTVAGIVIYLIGQIHSNPKRTKRSGA